jgi:hypothetical protein
MARLIVCEPCRLIYVPVPKCASTTMHQFLAALGGVDDRGQPRDCLPIRRGRVAPGGGGSYIIGCAAQDIAEIVRQYADFVWFSVVRDPYGRVLSNYQNKLNRYARRFEPGAYALAYAGEALQPWALVRHDHQERRIQRMQARIPFSRFVEALARHGIDWDHHYILQSRLLHMGDIPYHSLVRMEQLADGLRDVLIAAGTLGRAQDVVASLGRLNRSRGDAGPTIWTDTTREIVADLYRRDFEALGYAA